MAVALMAGMPDAALEPAPPAAECSGTRECVEADARLEQLPAHLQVRRVIGAGGSSVVYEAFHARLKVPVALKLLSVSDPAARLRMRREAELYAVLEDARIPRVYDVHELPDGTPYVVMEMVPGQSLAELLEQRGALPCEIAIDIVRQVLAILASVHARGVLHRDVKPANVLLDAKPEGGYRVRLVDFGIAKLSDGATDGIVLTQRGTLIGTPQYMAPERLVGEVADASADTYATGVMLYEMLAGAPPFTGASVSAVMVSVLREQPEPLLARCPALPPALGQLVARAMERSPSERFASAEEMLHQLSAIERELRDCSAPALEARGYAREQSIEQSVEPSRTRLARALGVLRSRHGLPVVLVLLLGLVAAAGWVAWAGRPAAPPLASEPATPLQARVPYASGMPPAAEPVPSASPSEDEGEPAANAPPRPELAPTPEPSSELHEQEQTPPRTRRTTIDYAELLPDNPY
jgi:serine/threonine-protein kinase